MSGDPLQLAGQVRRALPAIVGILGQAPEDDALEQSRRRRAAGGERTWLVFQDRTDETRSAAAAEGLPPGHHLVDHRAEGKDVGAGVRRASLDLFGRHVLDRADDGAFGRHLREWRRGARCLIRQRTGRLLGETEVEQLCAGLRDHHVAGLEIAMDQPVAVGRGQGVGDLDRQSERLIERQRSAAQARGQRLAVHVFEDQEVERLVGDCPGGLTLTDAFAADVVQRADVRMAERRHGLGLALEALAKPGLAGVGVRQDLDGDGSIEARVGRAIHLAHAADAKHTLDAIRAQASRRASGLARRR